MGNQQAIGEWARLAGLVMADGYLTLIPYSANNGKRSPSGFTALKPHIGFSNQDAEILQAVRDLYSREGIKFHEYIAKPRKGLLTTWLPVHNIIVIRFDSVRKVLENILPWMVGDKRTRAELLHRYASKERRGRRCRFDADDAEIIRAFLAVSPEHKKGRPTRLFEVLRDYEQNGGRFLPMI